MDIRVSGGASRKKEKLQRLFSVFGSPPFCFFGLPWFWVGHARKNNIELNNNYDSTKMESSRA